jgi:CheY-like chemotaxis protein
VVTEERPVVLVVEHDAEARKRIAAWLEDEGFETLECPGPSAPDYVCIAGRGVPCPLVQPVSVVVLDVRVEGEALMRGMSGEELLSYYLSAGKPVIALVGLDGLSLPYRDDIVALWRGTDRGPLVRAVQAAAGRVPGEARIAEGGR